MQQPQPLDPRGPYVVLGTAFIALVLAAIFGDMFDHIMCPIAAAFVVGMGVWVHRKAKASRAQVGNTAQFPEGWSAYGDGTDF